MAAAVLSAMFAVTTSGAAWAQSVGDYRSAATGNWNAIATWETFSGVVWVPAVATPTSANGVITIRSGHTVTISASGLTYDQVVVDAGGQVTVASGITHTLNNGTGTDLVINGTWLNQGGTWTVTGATWSVGAGGTFVHNTTSGIATPLGVATLDAASNFIYRGSSTLIPAVSTSGRTYGNLTFESTSGSWTASVSGAGTLTASDFTIGSGVTFSTTQTGAMTFAGNFTNNGTLTNSTGTQIYTFTGSGKSISGSGAISFETVNVNSGASITLNSPITIASTFTGTVTGTLITAAAGTGLTNSGTLNVNGTFQINQGSTAAGNNFVYGAAGTLVFNNTSGLTVNGTDVYWPSASGPPNVTVQNGGGVTLGSGVSRTLGGTLAFGAGGGKLTTGANTLTIGSGGSVTGASSAGYVFGKLNKTVVISGGNGSRGIL